MKRNWNAGTSRSNRRLDKSLRKIALESLNMCSTALERILNMSKLYPYIVQPFIHFIG